MSIDISGGYKWESVRLQSLPNGTPDASISTSGEVLTCEAIEGTSAKATKAISVRAGDVVTVECMARLITGSIASISIDFPGIGDLQNNARVDSTEWKAYRVSYIVDERAMIAVNAANGFGMAYIHFGVFAGQTGKVEFMLPKISVNHSQIGAMRVMANATIHLHGSLGIAEVTKDTYTNHACNQGVYSVSKSGDDILITIDPTYNTDNETFTSYFPIFPQFHTELTVGSNYWRWVPRVTGYDKTTGVVTVNMFDELGVLKTLGEIDSDVYFNFKAEIN